MLILKVVFSLWGANAIIFFLIECKHIRNGGVNIHTILCGHCQYTCIYDYCSIMFQNTGDIVLQPQVSCAQRDYIMAYFIFNDLSSTS